MARSYAFTCDGCDAQAGRNSPDLPQYWADVALVASGFTNWKSGGGKDVTAYFLLCSDCQILLASHINPREWPRATQAARPSEGPAGGQPPAGGEQAARPDE